MQVYWLIILSIIILISFLRSIRAGLWDRRIRRSSEVEWQASTPTQKKVNQGFVFFGVRRQVQRDAAFNLL